jgi:SagB-type dehydrogenase family enzyme
MFIARLYTFLVILIFSAIIGAFFILPDAKESGASKLKGAAAVELPQPSYSSNTSIEEGLHKRRSIREYKGQPLTLPEISQLLWACQGITDPEEGFRIAPSAGALYPLEVYLAVGEAEGLEKGVYKYLPASHCLEKIRDKDIRVDLSQAALGQECVGNGAVVIVLSAVYQRTAKKYAERGIRYVHMEAGSAVQNLYLQAESLNLGTVVVGAFDDPKVKKILNLKDQETPLAIMPVGRK